ncbi:hypothetical protein ACIBF1_44360 [Spirillospora sp. NPDC050679]
MTTPTGHLDDDADGNLGDDVEVAVEGRVMLMQCRAGEVVRLPGHHPAVVVLDDVPGPEHWTDDWLIPIAWRDHAPRPGADPDSGITSLSPRALIEVLYRLW